jgi:hypothetical protein
VTGVQTCALPICELEAEARSLYELTNDVKVEQVGFCLSDDGKAGCSPDGLVGKKGLLEIKCPSMAIHIGYLLDNSVPTDYFQQVQGQLFITGREWLDFISYYPAIRPMLVRVKRDNEFIEKLETELNIFCEKLEKLIIKIK